MTNQTATRIKHFILDYKVTFSNLERTSKIINQIDNLLMNLRNDGKLNREEFREYYNYLQIWEENEAIIRADQLTPLKIEVQNLLMNFELLRKAPNGLKLVIVTETLANGIRVSISGGGNKNAIDKIVMIDKEGLNQEFTSYNKLIEGLKPKGFNFENRPINTKDKNTRTMNLFNGNVSDNRKYFEEFCRSKNLKFEVYTKEGQVNYFDKEKESK